jgi:hypothetical protein
MLSNVFVLICILFFAVRNSPQLSLSYSGAILLGLSAFGLACLAKWTAWAFAPVFGAFLLADVFRIFRRQTLGRLPTSRPRITAMPLQVLALIFIMLLFSAVVIANWKFYGVNLATFGTIAPDCKVAWGHSKCMSMVNQYRAYYAIHMDHLNQPRIGLISFSSSFIETLLIRLFSFVGHQQYVYNSDFMLIPQVYVLSLGLILLPLRNRWGLNNVFDQKGRVAAIEAAVIFAFYLLVFLIQNYKRYLWLGELGYGLQGRYLLPAWPCLLGLASLSLARFEKKLSNLVAFGLIIPTLQVLLMTSSFSYFVDRLKGQPELSPQRATEICEAKRTAIKVVPTKNELVALPSNGFIDEIQLEENGNVLKLRGWIAPPKDLTGKSIDGIVVALDIPVEGAELTQQLRLDVVQAKAADFLCTGFKIRLRLPSPLQALPTGGSLCVAASSVGQLIVRTVDNKEMPCR